MNSECHASVEHSALAEHVELKRRMMLFFFRERTMISREEYALAVRSPLGKQRVAVDCTYTVCLPYPREAKREIEESRCVRCTFVRERKRNCGCYNCAVTPGAEPYRLASELRRSKAGENNGNN